MRNLVAVLGYHKVGPIAEEGRFLNVEPTDLAAQVAFLKRRGFAFAQAKDLVEHPDERTVCLTFDDAYLSFLTYGVDVLRSAGVVASTYVVTDLVGEASLWDGEHARPLGSWELLRQAEEAGIEIGNHTGSHARLGELGQIEQEREISKGHLGLAARRFDSRSLCLPYGSYNDETIGAMTMTGYLVGLTVEKGLVSAEDDRRLLKRVMVSYSDRVPGLWYKLFVKPGLKKLTGRA